MSKKTLSVAMIGYQFMGRAHSNAWRQVGRFFDLPVEPVMQVICGRNAAGAAEAAAKLGWNTSATDWREVVQRPDVDIVDICTPGDSHADIAIAAAEAGKTVFCEKPLANTVAEAERMLDAVSRAGVLHMLCHNYRRAPAVALAKRMIDAGEIGEVRHYRGTYLQDWIVDPQFPRVWRLDKSKAGSGALGDIASHSLDLARYLVGEISEVSGLLKNVHRRTPAGTRRDGKGRRRRRGVKPGAVRRRRGRLGRGFAFLPRAQELQPLRDQRLDRQSGVRSGAHERAAGVPRNRAERRVSHRTGHRRRPPVRRKLVAAGAYSRLRAYLYPYRL